MKANSSSMPHHRAPKMSRKRRKAASLATSHQAEMDRNDAIQAEMDRREIEDSSDGSDGNIASKGPVNASKGLVTRGLCSDEQVKKCWNEVRTKRIENAKQEEEAIRTCDKHKNGDSDWRGYLAIELQVQEAILDLTTDQNPVGFTQQVQEAILDLTTDQNPVGFTLGDRTSWERGPTAVVVDFWMTCPLELLRNNIMKFTSLNHEDHFNQVAITNRRNNTVWRSLVMDSENLRHTNQRMILTHYIYDIIPRVNDQLDCDVPVQLLHDLLALI